MEEEAGSAAFAVLSLEGAQGGGVAEAGAGGGFDFDGKEPVAGLDHKVDFFADGGAPVEDFRGIEAGVAPSEKVVQDQVFEVGAAGLGFLAEVEGDAGIAPVDLGGLDEALGAVDGVGGQANEQVGGLQQVEVATDGWLRQAHVAAKLGLVDELAQAEAGGAHEAPEVGEGGDG